jgi:hypothetical protein
MGLLSRNGIIEAKFLFARMAIIVVGICFVRNKKCERTGWSVGGFSVLLAWF